MTSQIRTLGKTSTAFLQYQISPTRGLGWNRDRLIVPAVKVRKLKGHQTQILFAYVKECPLQRGKNPERFQKYDNINAHLVIYSRHEIYSISLDNYKAIKNKI